MIAQRWDFEQRSHHDLYDALEILKRIQLELYNDGNVAGWRIVTRAYERVAAQL